jgi:hypothetical protein
MIRLTEFKITDLDGMDPVEGAFPGDYVQRAKLHMQLGPCLSIKDGGTTLAVCGLVMPWPRMGELWGVVDLRAAQKPIASVKAFRKAVDFLIKHWNIRRCQCTVKSDLKRGIRMVQLLGFQVEGLLQGYGPDGADHFMYSRLAL